MILNRKKGESLHNIELSYIKQLQCTEGMMILHFVNKQKIPFFTIQTILTAIVKQTFGIKFYGKTSKLLGFKV